MRPQDATTELGSAALSMALGVPHPTVRRWLRAWHALGVAGVRLVRSAGRHGQRYVCDAALVSRWRAGELPSPYLAA